MIKGPNGTAKPEIAYLFHRNAVCKRGYIFRRLNCSLSTSAEDIQAAIKEAGEGTLYLHDVDLLQPDVQRALIKILACPRDRGGVQARVLSSVTNASMLLPFLKDRLAIGVFKVPPLADRKVGIEAMAKRLAQHAAEQNVRPVIEPDKKFLAMLCTHDWPANDYELANFMARHQILARAVGPNWYHKPEIASDGCVSGVFDRSALPTNLNHKEAREKFHTDYLRALITATSGQISNAALKAGVDRTLLSRWLKERGLVDEARRLRQG